MKPALAAVVRKSLAGQWPSALEMGAMLFESGCDQTEARSLVKAYAQAIADIPRTSAEDEFMRSLRAFSLAHE
jgi:hypothetical protein